MEWLQETIEAVVAATAGALAGGYATKKFGERNREAQKEIDSIAPIPEFAENARSERNRLLPLEEKLINYFEGLHKDARQKLTKGDGIAIYNFEAGWRILFDDLFNPSSPNERALRDFSIPGYIGQTVEDYNFDTYPHFVGGYLKGLEKDARKSHEYKIRFLVLCDRDSENFAHGEKFLCSLLALKTSSDSSLSIVDKFGVWRENKGAPEVEIRILNRATADKLAEVSPVKPHSPFNVYGQKAVSVSIVKRGLWAKPIPHLEISLNQTTVEEYRALFDGLWRQSENLQRIIFAATKDEVRTLGEGKLFARWADLET